MDKEITIGLEEYKELLIIKGKYEELTKKQCISLQNVSDYGIKAIPCERNSTPF